MFESVGWSEILVLLVAALFILGPERLPEAAAWMGRSVRKVRDFATGARQQLKDEMGPEYEELRRPIEDLRGLRNFDPKRAVTQHLFDGDPDPAGLNNINGTRPVGGDGAQTTPYAGGTHGGVGGIGAGSAGTGAAPATSPAQEPLKSGEKPPVDPDAT
ncbi:MULTISPECIES: Sec-independent protein translocase protein TatB [Prauserella salsuginis group]|uniref:Sec-independent protein translocase protein TatB n=1 Tax=Prauserella salsuginis TaxID=387889 RepID=A0ABW6G6L5_9PSEU|nr:MULTISPECIES: Sec-independent protein translocase protein TatB [Prauserella salsuginis group]MCR3722763.1 sec-independent protein translocase protein TatB [Prauserella flava]MCR3737182.1 sec-independent protein translocase protein TatB [Prauserella salsuginis]